jgi:ketosteroid isomerase-like protein
MSQADADVVTKFLNAFTTGQLETATSLLHRDIVISEAEGLPYPGDHVGLAGFQNLLGKMFEPFEMTVHDFEVTDAGSIVVVKLLMEFKSRASGRTVAMPSVELYTVSDGLVSKIDVYYKDSKAIADLVSG